MKRSGSRKFRRMAAMLSAAALFAAGQAAAQAPAAQETGLQTPAVQASEGRRYTMPDTLSLQLQLQPLELPPLRSALQVDEAPRIDWQGARVKPVYPSIRIDLGRRPTRIYVINNIILQVGGYVNLTNGQAWIWSPYPNGFLDARTLSMPMPR